MISIADLRFAWPRATQDCLVLDALHIAAGRTVFLHGPSGCGKSTLLGLLAGVLVPGSGRVSLMGTDWAALPGARRDAFRADHVGYIFQQFNLLGYLSVLDNVMLPCRLVDAAQPACVGRCRGGSAQATRRGRLLKPHGAPAGCTVATARRRELVSRVSNSGWPPSGP